MKKENRGLQMEQAVIVGLLSEPAAILDIAGRLRAEMFGDADRQQLQRALAGLQRLPIIVEYCGSDTVDDIHAKALMLLIAKNRNGATGMSRFRYNPSMTCLTDYDLRLFGMKENVNLAMSVLRNADYAEHTD